MDAILSSLGFGIVTAAVLAPAAIGFTLQFSATNVLNIAFGSQMTLAAFIAYELSIAGVDIWVALVVAGVFGAVTSVLLNRGLLMPMRRRGTTFFGMIVATIALALVVEYGIELIWGPGSFHYSYTEGKALHLGAVLITPAQIVIVGISVAVMVAVHVLLRHTKVGRAMRGTSVNDRLARACGIPTQRIIDVAWGVSGGLGGIAGVMLAMSLSSLSFNMGDTFLLEIIAAAILGGIGSSYGAMIGAFIIGIVLEESALVLSGAYAPISAFAILILVLLVRPTGIAGGAAKVKGVAA
ncbi:MAG: branched-chain amino acid ABC transporter permease [Acidimicrobiales bacterium]